MKVLLIIVVLFNIFGWNTAIGQTTKAKPKSKPPRRLYRDSAKASFRIISNDSEGLYNYEWVDVQYKLEYVHVGNLMEAKQYIVKFTTTSKSCSMCELPNSTIKVELHPLDNPTTTDFMVVHECDKIELDYDTYKITKFACCDGEDEIEVRDYHYQQIINGDVQILKGRIPNSPMSLYFAYKRSDYSDTLSLGKAIISYNSSDIYEVTILSFPLKPGDCGYHSPEISVYSVDKDSTFKVWENEFTLWNLDAIESKSQVNNIAVELVFDCTSQRVVQIPLINGLPFGKKERKQTISLPLK